MDELKLKLVDMLKWFNTYCRNNNLVYYIVGGTMLGAIRHEGFIPWDDDIDVAMPRADYEKFINMVNDGKYRVETIYNNSKDYVYPFAKLYDTSTLLIENTRYKTKRGIYLDVFPLDGIGNTLEESKLNFKAISRKINFMSTKVCALNKNRKFYKNFAIICARLIPEFLVSHTKLIKRIDRVAQKFPYSQMSYVANLVGNWGAKEIMPKDFFGEPKEYCFEGLKVFGVQNYDGYLTNLYGDYMKLPPIDKQKSHHDYLLCDLNKSYLEE